MELLGKLPATAFAAPSSTVAALTASREAANPRGPAFKTVAGDYVVELRAAGLEDEKGIGEKE